MKINQMSFNRNVEDRPPLPNSEKKNWQIKMLAKNQKESSIEEEVATPKGKNLRIKLQPLQANHSCHHFTPIINHSDSHPILNAPMLTS